MTITKTLSKYLGKTLAKRKKMQVDLVTPKIPAAHDLRIVQPIAYAMPTYFTKCSMSSLPGRYIFTPPWNTYYMLQILGSF